MRKKVITPECVSCDDMGTTTSGQMQCQWGIGEAKLLVPHKGKKPRFCNLVRKEYERDNIPAS